MKQKLIFLTAFFTAAFAFSAEYYVDASRTDDTGSATNWATAKKTIQAAVDLATDGDTVWVTNGTYNVGGAKTPDHSLMNRVCITSAITVRSVNGREVTIIEGVERVDGENVFDSVRGVFMTNSCALIGFTVTGGQTYRVGNDALDVSGGGIFLTDGCVVSNCTIIDNAALLDGGGVFLSHGGIVESCIISRNKVKYRGGGANLYFGGKLVGCTLKGNSAERLGGGAYCREDGVIDRCIFTDNTSDLHGGGVALYKGGRLSNSVLHGNKAVNYGGGVYLRENGTIKNCTMVQNTSSVAGGGVCLKDGGTLYNSIVWGNRAPKGDDVYKKGSGMKVRYICCSDGDAGSKSTTKYPLFVDAENGNFLLLAGSPCINAGRNAYTSVGVDLNGNPRISDELVDLGAYEFSGGR